MRNLKQDLWFQKTISIYSPGPENASSPPPSVLNKFYFFPEGGYLVNGLESKVGFKSVDQYGNGLQISGIILNQMGNTITNLSSSEMGIGTFKLKPDVNVNYTARVLIKDTIYHDFPLPEALLKGIVMQVDNNPYNTIAIKISENIDSNNNTGYLLAQSKGKIYYQSSLELPSQGETRINISKNLFPEGVAQLTLFSSSGEPVAERLVYINHQNNLNIEIISDKPYYLPREKITLYLQAKDREGNPLYTNLSLAVADAKLFGTGNPGDHILSYLNLSSEINGKIENPAWYFGKNKAEALDNLLLTQGWRRFTWEEILKGKTPETNFFIEDELALRGRVIDNSTGRLALGSSVTMTISGEQPQYLFDLTDDKGIFIFHELNLEGPQTLFLKAIEKYSKQESLEVIIDSTSAPAYNLNFNSINIKPKINKEFQYLISNKKLIEESFNYFSPIEEENQPVDQKDNFLPKIGQFKVSYHADEVINMENYLSFSSMVDVIRELVRGVIIRRKGDQYRLRMLDSVTKFYFKKEPVYLIDGIPVDDANQVMNLDPSIVKYITVSKPPNNFYDFGIMGESGVLAIYTNEINKNLENASKTLKVNFKGYDRPRQFYAPDHGSGSTPFHIPDFRPLLYWNPSIVTDHEGKATISFYASDDVSHWQVSAEGLSDSGIPGTETIIFETKFPEN
jgi:hypothetical protein